MRPSVRMQPDETEILENVINKPMQLPMLADRPNSRACKGWQRQAEAGGDRRRQVEAGCQNGVNLEASLRWRTKSDALLG